MIRLILIWFLSALGIFAQSIIIDTDCGADDLLAINMLLQSPEIEISAITTVHGLTNPDTGYIIIKRLLEKWKRADIPVYAGKAEAIQSKNSFPDEWIKQNQQSGLELTDIDKDYSEDKNIGAVDFIKAKAQKESVKIIALGPLTNLASAFSFNENINLHEIIIMGGALNVPGNITDSDGNPDENKYSEWNFYLDPEAAATILKSGNNIKLVSLDATNQVPITFQHFESLKTVNSFYGWIQIKILDPNSEWIKSGGYFAWDPLAASIFLEPGIMVFEKQPVAVLTGPEQEGRTKIDSVNGTDVFVPAKVNKDIFYSLFVSSHNK